MEFSPQEAGDDTPLPEDTPKPCIPIHRKASCLIGLTHRRPTIRAMHGRDTSGRVSNTTDVVTQKSWATKYGWGLPSPRSPMNIRAAPCHCPSMHVTLVATHLSHALHPNPLLGDIHPHLVDPRSHRPSFKHPACGLGTIRQLIVSWHHGRPYLGAPRQPPAR